MKNIFLLLLAIIAFACQPKTENTQKSIELVEAVDSTSIDFISEEIRKNPGNIDLFVQRAYKHYEENHVPEGIRDLNLALQLDTMNESLYVKIAEFNLAIGRSEISKKTLDKCVALFPKNTDALLKLAEIHFLVQQYKEAMELIVKAQKIDPLLAQPFFLKGLIYKEAGDTIKAIENFQITVNKDPYQYHAYMLLGSIYSNLQDSIALDYFRIAAKLQPESIEAWYNIGMFYQESASFQNAINAYQYILDSIDVEYEFAAFNIGFIYLEGLKDYKKALAQFTRTIDLRGNYYQAYYNRGYTYELLGDYNNAKTDYHAALNILPNYQLSIDGLNRLDRKMAE